MRLFKHIFCIIHTPYWDISRPGWNVTITKNTTRLRRGTSPPLRRTPLNSLRLMNQSGQGRVPPLKLRYTTLVPASAGLRPDADFHSYLPRAERLSVFLSASCKEAKETLPGPRTPQHKAPALTSIRLRRLQSKRCTVETEVRKRPSDSLHGQTSPLCRLRRHRRDNGGIRHRVKVK